MDTNSLRTSPSMFPLIYRSSSPSIYASFCSQYVIRATWTLVDQDPPLWRVPHIKLEARHLMQSGDRLTVYQTRRLHTTGMGDYKWDMGDWNEWHENTQWNIMNITYVRLFYKCTFHDTALMIVQSHTMPFKYTEISFRINMFFNNSVSVVDYGCNIFYYSRLHS